MNQPMPASTAAPATRRRRLRFWSAIAAGFCAVGFIGGEGFLRWRYGLGDVPRILNDPAMEYRAAPDGHYRRLGHRIDINAWSMRSDDFPLQKPPGQHRVLVMGDSVINGGNYADQSELATAIVQRELRASLGDPGLIVGNISAGSWGPQNELAYVNRFGTFGADVIAIVVSSHDASDEIGPLSPGEAQISPAYHLAWGEFFDRVFHRTDNGDRPPGPPGRPEVCLAAFDALLTRIQHDTGRPAIVLFHYEKGELDAEQEPAGFAAFRTVCQQHAVEPISLRDADRDARTRGTETYRDSIHPNAAGQRLLADVLLTPIRSALGSPASQPATTEPAR